MKWEGPALVELQSSTKTEADGAFELTVPLLFHYEPLVEPLLNLSSFSLC